MVRDGAADAYHAAAEGMRNKERFEWVLDLIFRLRPCTRLWWASCGRCVDDLATVWAALLVIGTLIREEVAARLEEELPPLRCVQCGRRIEDGRPRCQACRSEAREREG